LGSRHAWLIYYLNGEDYPRTLIGGSRLGQKSLTVVRQGSEGFWMRDYRGVRVGRGRGHVLLRSGAGGRERKVSIEYLQ
jgi:hypothetical protein